MKTTVNLVATRERLERDFPNHPAVASESTMGIASANYQVDLELIKSALGRWLAMRVLTTRRDDDASHVLVLLPHTEEGLHNREFGHWLASQTRVSDSAQAEEVLQRIEAWIAKRRKVIQVYRDFRFRTYVHEFPVYGSKAAVGADTPEAFFDLVARQIRETGGVILWAGLGHHPLPDSLARTMATQAGGGDHLTRLHNSRITVSA